MRECIMFPAVVGASLAHNAEASASCWSGGFNARLCCDLRWGSGGNPICWDSEYTFDRCCRAAAVEENPLKKRFDALCRQDIQGGDPWSYDTCCNTALGPRGMAACWDLSHTFALCCTDNADSRAARAGIILGVWALLAVIVALVECWRSPTADTGATDAAADWKSFMSTRSAQGVAESKARDASLDQARFYLMVLIIWGHFLIHWRQPGYWTGLIYNWLNCCHVPAFAFISGAVSCRGGYTAQDLFDKLLMPFVLSAWASRFAFLGMDAFVDPLKGPSFVRLWQEPFTRMWHCDDAGGNWYLMALFWWRLCCPWLGRARFPILLAVVVSLLGPYPNPWTEADQPSPWEPGSGLALFGAREAFFYFPQFALGFCGSRRLLAWLPRRAFQLLAMGWLFGALPLIVHQRDYRPGAQWGKWMWARYRVSLLEGGIAADLMRYTLHAASGISLLSVVQLLPAPRWLITAGQRTAYALLVHRVLIRVTLVLAVHLRAQSVFSTMQLLWILLAVSALLTWLLTSTFTVWLFRWMLQPRWHQRFLWTPTGEEPRVLVPDTMASCASHDTGVDSSAGVGDLSSQGGANKGDGATACMTAPSGHGATACGVRRRC